MQTTLQRNASSVYSGSTQFSKVSECVLDLQKVFQGFKSGINLSAMPKESSWRLDHLCKDPLVQIFMVFTSMVQKTTHKHAHTKAQGDLRLNSQTYFMRDQFTTFWRCLPLSIHSKGSSVMLLFMLF